MAGNSNSGRSAKPSFLKVIEGNAGKKSASDLLRDIETQTVGAAEPPMPDYLSPAAQEEWSRVVPDLLVLGWVHQLDMMALASYCEAVADWRRFRQLIAKKNAGQDESGDVQTYSTGAKQISVWRQLANDAEKRANAAGALFGMSPLARRNMKAAPQPQGELFTNEPKAAASRYFT
ncbi:P27 family phage terminase small subunit [Comamonas terrigena]|uniref:P27 family phage terminase small subunit n=1 Tax=Comamonas terrigena TaxID=32013 RepID=UPI002355908B|nr:P27 family phage terminase small subunit [Comamonas terrigena]